MWGVYHQPTRLGSHVEVRTSIDVYKNAVTLNIQRGCEGNLCIMEAPMSIVKMTTSEGGRYVFVCPYRLVLPYSHTGGPVTSPQSTCLAHQLSSGLSLFSQACVLLGRPALLATTLSFLSTVYFFLLKVLARQPATN